MRCSVAIGCVLVCLSSCAAPEVPPAAPPPPAPAPVAAPAPPPAAAAPALTPEQQKKADEQAKLEQELAKLDADNQAELARMTPEVKQAAAALSGKAYPTLQAAIKAALKGTHRRPGDAERDAQRHPLETLELFGIKPTHSVLEYGPGEGWYTELLAPALAKSGKLYVTTSDPNGPASERSTLYGRRTKYFLERLPEAYGKVEPVIIDPKALKLGLDGKLDAVLLIRGMHGMYNNKQLELWLAEFHRALKPNGVLGVEQQRAAADKTADQTSKQGYLPEAFVIKTVEAAGFKLAAKSEINANAKDTKDYPEGVWSLPPTLREGEKNREKYLAIGESDRMTLKFVKVERAKSP